MFKDEILDILVCIKCKGKLIKNEDNLECHSCKIYYPIVDSIPRMVEEAIKPLNLSLIHI